MSLLRKIIFVAKSGGVKLGGGEASGVGGVVIGYGCVNSAGGGAGIWSFPIDGEGAGREGSGGYANSVGGVAIE